MERYLETKKKRALSYAKSSILKIGQAFLFYGCMPGSHDDAVFQRWRYPLALPNSPVLSSV